ncbi:unnamed protein product [Leptidea sinapis]|uniref:Uncharacterized protein n=1 Tax=Leptidea sinapis TaxID=189913 RepID=A0A5E4QVM5_9NEOP|nr:unnamed protein product [Leptidea sinapis]
MEEYQGLYGAPFKPAQTLVDMAKDRQTRMDCIINSEQLCSLHFKEINGNQYILNTQRTPNNNNKE